MKYFPCTRCNPREQVLGWNKDHFGSGEACKLIVENKKDHCSLTDTKIRHVIQSQKREKSKNLGNNLEETEPEN